MSLFSMGKTIFKSLFHGPYTVQYPFEKKPVFERTRGKIDIDIDSCIFCTLCAKRCPTNAIVVDKAKTLWSIQRLQCIQCGYCVEACPKKCLHMNNQYTAPSSDRAVDEFIKDARVSDNQENN